MSFRLITSMCIVGLLTLSLGAAPNAAQTKSKRPNPPQTKKKMDSPGMPKHGPQPGAGSGAGCKKDCHKGCGGGSNNGGGNGGGGNGGGGNGGPGPVAGIPGPNGLGHYGPFATIRRAQEVVGIFQRMGYPNTIQFHNGDGQYVLPRR